MSDEMFVATSDSSNESTESLLPRDWTEKAAHVMASLSSMDNKPIAASVSRLTGKIWSLVLHRASYMPELRGRTLLLEFEDHGGTAEFPLGLLSEAPVMPSNYTTLSIGAMSGRHVSMDFFVAAHLHLNSQLSGILHAAEIESACYKRTLQVLSDLAESADRPLVVELILTGLEPMVFGTCRALAEFMSHPREPRVYVRMRYFIGRGVEDTTCLTTGLTSGRINRQSLGAKLSDYAAGPLWG